MRDSIIKRFLSRKESFLLTELIRKEKGKLYSKETNELLSTLKKLYEPSILSLKITVLLYSFVISLSFLVRCKPFNSSFLEGIQNNVFTINAGIAAIVFAVAIFIAESLRDKEDRDRGLVLLKKSYLFPLLVITILNFLFFIFVEVNIISIIPTIVASVLSIASVYNLISILLNKTLFYTEYQRFLSEIVERDIDLAVEERLGNNILFARLNTPKCKLKQTSRIFLEDSDKFEVFRSGKGGVVKDINFKALEELSDIIEKAAHARGYCWDKGKKTAIDSKGDYEIIVPEMEELRLNQDRYLTTGFRETIEADSIVLAVSKELLKGEGNRETIDTIGEYIGRVFIIESKTNIREYSDALRVELSNLNSKMLRAIEEKTLNIIDEIERIYIKLIEVFIESIQKYGLRYTKEQTKRERASLLGGWSEITLIKKDVIEFLDSATNTKNLKVIKSLSYLPVAIAARGITYGDYYIFQGFIGFSKLLYEKSCEEEERIKEILFDGSWRYLKETADFYIETELLKKGLDENRLESLKDFSIYIVRVFQDMLYSAFKNRDYSSFKIFLHSVAALFSHFEPSEESPPLIQLKWWLERETSEQEKKILLSKIGEREKYVVIEMGIKNSRKEMIFGLTSQIMNECVFRKGNGDKEDLKQFYALAEKYLPTELADVTKVFTSSIGSDKDEFWGWIWWDQEEFPEWTIHPVDFNGKLVDLYCVSILKFLANMKDEELEKAQLPIGRDFEYLTRDDGALKQRLDDIDKNRETWATILDDKELDRIPYFLELLKKKNLELKKEELGIVREGTLSTKRVEEFKRQVIEGFWKGTTLRDIFRTAGLYLNKSSEMRAELDKTGLKVIYPKEAFFDNWHVHYGDFGKKIGANVGQFENSFLFDKLKDMCMEKDPAELDQILGTFKNPERIFILAADIRKPFIPFLENSPKHKPHWVIDKKSIEEKKSYYFGRYEFNDTNIPIYLLQRHRDRGKVLILNTDELGELIQYSPLETKDEANSVIDIFSINIGVFSEDPDLIEAFIEKSEEWLTEAGDRVAQEQRLKELVLIEIFEKIEFTPHSHFKGYILNTPDKIV